MDLEQIAKMAESGDTEGLMNLAEEKDASDPSPTEPVEADPDATVPETDAPAPAAEEAHAVANSAGEAVIPYAVLKGAREQASELMRQNELLKSQLDDLTARQSAPATGVPAAEAPGVPDADAKIASLRERAAALKEDFPELAESLEQNADLLAAMQAQIGILVQEQTNTRNKAEAERQATVQDAVQEAIDATPALSLWQASHPELFAEAVDVDRLLRGKPEWADKPMADRFGKVVDMVRALRPDAPVPNAPQNKTPEPSVKSRVPALGDIPGGVAPATTLAEQVDNMSAAALGNKFMSMTPEQITDYLATM